MADEQTHIDQLDQQIKLLEALQVEVKNAVQRAKDKRDLLKNGVPLNDPRVFPPKA